MVRTLYPSYSVTEKPSAYLSLSCFASGFGSISSFLSFLQAVTNKNKSMYL